MQDSITVLFSRHGDVWTLLVRINSFASCYILPEDSIVNACHSWQSSKLKLGKETDLKLKIADQVMNKYMEQIICQCLQWYVANNWPIHLHLNSPPGSKDKVTSIRTLHLEARTRLFHLNSPPGSKDKVTSILVHCTILTDQNRSVGENKSSWPMLDNILGEMFSVLYTTHYMANHPYVIL